MILGFDIHDVYDDPTNNTPDFKLPPLWSIMAGCPDQELDLAPYDSDGDTVRGRN